MTILCICAQVTESEYREFCKDNRKFFEDDDFMIRIDCMGRGCEACLDRIEEIRKEVNQCIK